MSKALSVGIDIGTTYPCVGIFQQGHVEIIQNNEGEKKLPRYVGFPDSERLIGCPVISSSFFRNIKDMAEVHLSKPVKDATVSVPVCFSDVQRRAIKVAGDEAGLNVMHIIDELTAAAIGYCFKKKVKENRKFLIFGDGMKFSIFVIEDGLIEKKSTSGDQHLGGEDFDNRIGIHLLDLVVKALQDAKMNITDINNVILIGSSTRVPEVQKLLCDFFGEKALELIEFDVVAHGAAIKGAILKGLLDIESPFHVTSLNNQTCFHSQAGAEASELIFPPDSGFNSARVGNVPSKYGVDETATSSGPILASCTRLCPGGVGAGNTNTSANALIATCPPACDELSSPGTGNGDDESIEPKYGAGETATKYCDSTSMKTSSSGLCTGNAGDVNTNPKYGAGETATKYCDSTSTKTSSPGLCTGNAGDVNTILKSSEVTPSPDVTAQSAGVRFRLLPSTGMLDVEVHAADQILDEISGRVIEELPDQPAEIISFHHDQPADVIPLLPEVIPLLPEVIDPREVPFHQDQPADIIPLLSEFIDLPLFTFHQDQPADIIQLLSEVIDLREVPFHHGQPASITPPLPEFIDLREVPFHHGQPASITPPLPEFIDLREVPFHHGQPAYITPPLP